jgi:VIT1/CCC1 family predicted Fe2+/Mn2+ transporter
MSVGLVKISDDGDITVHSAPIQPDVANILGFSIAAIFGCCVFWIIFIAQTGLVTIIQSTGIGLIIGTLISLLHDFSYKKEDISNHLLKNLDH